MIWTNTSRILSVSLLRLVPCLWRSLCFLTQQHSRLSNCIPNDFKPSTTPRNLTKTRHQIQLRPDAARRSRASGNMSLEGDREQARTEIWHDLFSRHRLSVLREARRRRRLLSGRFHGVLLAFLRKVNESVTVMM
ncbi:hypothetical protein EDD85DRAFT_161226 [Armillaria nabsnona]|nr:hypothetical protein EDD85DRAFT_161226 [Armillaria nabsnona]